VLALGVAIGMLGSVIPNSFELMALRPHTAARFQHFDES
jgi:threonine/homoserine efflux transporter RhtA